MNNRRRRQLKQIINPVCDLCRQPMAEQEQYYCVERLVKTDKDKAYDSYIVLEFCQGCVERARDHHDLTKAERQAITGFINGEGNNEDKEGQCSCCNRVLEDNEPSQITIICCQKITSVGIVMNSFQPIAVLCRDCHKTNTGANGS